MRRKVKPAASISLDLDNQWSYMKIHGDEGWDSYPSYFDIFVPYFDTFTFPSLSVWARPSAAKSSWARETWSF